MLPQPQPPQTPSKKRRFFGSPLKEMTFQNPTVNVTVAERRPRAFDVEKTRGAKSTTLTETKSLLPVKEIVGIGGRSYRSAGRVEKKKPQKKKELHIVKSSKQQRSRRGGKPDLLTRLKESLENIRTGLSEKADKELAEMEEVFSAQLTLIAEGITTKAEAILEDEERIYRPIAEDKLLITRKTPAQGFPDQEQALLGQRMEDFKKDVQAEEGHLQRLWQEWVVIQAETISIAIEILGPGAFSSSTQPEKVMAASADLKARIEAAMELHQQNNYAFDTGHPRFSELIAALNNTTDQTLKTLKAQQQEWTLAQRTLQQSIKTKFEMLAV